MYEVSYVCGSASLYELTYVGQVSIYNPICVMREVVYSSEVMASAFWLT